MSDRTTIYDLGNLDGVAVSAGSGGQRRKGDTAPLRAATARPAALAHPASGFDVSGTLSLFLPGMGQMVRGEVALGLFFIVWLAFLGVFSWAAATTLDRITETLRLLELPGAPGLWVICGAFALAALLHLANILTADPYPGMPRAAHPVAAGIASAIVPGWGQVLNGSYKRACLFVASLWIVAAIWILALPGLQAYLAELRLYIPDNVLVVTHPAVRWTAPAVIWALAVYDAASTAAGRR